MIKWQKQGKIDKQSHYNTPLNSADLNAKKARLKFQMYIISSN